MNQILFFAAGGGIIESARETGEKFGFNTSLFVSQVISFCIVAFLLHRFAYKPILKVLEERRHRIEEGLANAEKINAELAKTEAAAAESAREKANLKREIGRLVVETTGRVTGKILTPDDQKRLADETTRQLVA